MELYVRVHADGSAESESRIAGERDLLAELSLARSAGRSLIGDDPQVLIGVVPDEWVVVYGRELVTRWQRLTDDEAHAGLMVLTACRIWRFAAEGVHRSKVDACPWALARSPALRAVDAVLRDSRQHIIQAARLRPTTP
jgi:hypothetical protein